MIEQTSSENIGNSHLGKTDIFRAFSRGGASKAVFQCFTGSNRCWVSERSDPPARANFRPGGLTMNEQIDTERSRSRSTEDRTVEIRRLDTEQRRDLRLSQRDVDVPLPEAPIPPAGVGSLEK